ncbi:MAG: penicillin-binding protein A [Ruminococcaceae bacterium]|nr:penicillin-binding protein A [Oscillospiraceae bacterium]
MDNGQLKKRCTALYALVCFLAVIAVGRLFYLQIMKGENYRTISDSRLARNIPVKAPRGEILDRYGRALVTNREGYTVAIAKINDDKQALNQVILNMVNLFWERGLSYSDSLPISKEAPFTFAFAGKDEETQQKAAQKFIVDGHYSTDVTADDVIEKYVKKYEIGDNYTPEEIRRIVGVRYEMEKRNFSSNNAYVFGTDIDIETITTIKEQRERFFCVTVYSEPIRQYTGGTLAAHLLGYVGIINAEEYAELSKDNYGMNDFLGKQGVEKAFEQYLRGTDGTNSIERKIKEGETELVYSRDPVPGSSVILTLDMDLQRVAEESLERNIQKIASTARYGSGHDAFAGAAVALDLNSGDVLAMASYPTYNPERFNADYNQLSADTTNPLLNRAINGIYEPGSTFKLCTALAALESDKVGSQETIATTGVYNYLNHNFMCNIYRTSGGNHGVINISQAIQHSCNYFFYEMGRRTGIETIEDYARRMGLGEYTGIELSEEEAKGQVAGPVLREKNGGIWYPGDVLQAAIGQSDNLFTPLQIANYMATLANGGTNYEVHLLKAVKSNVDDTIITETAPKIRNKIEISEENLQAVLNGMQLATSEGTASAAFADFPFKTGGKTGSAQVSRGSSNGIYIGYAPYDNPQIAVAIVVEHGGSGGNAAYIARDIFQQYFFGNNETEYKQLATNVLLP